MATKSCPECDQQVRKNVFFYLNFSILLAIASAQFFYFILFCVYITHNQDGNGT